MRVQSLKGLPAPLLYQTWAGRTKGRNCLQCLWSCFKGRKLIYKGLIFKVLLFKWYYTVGGVCSSKKKTWKVVRDTLYSDDAVKDIPNIVARFLPTFHECIQGRVCCIFLFLCFSLSGFSVQWIWAREMSFLVNAVSCLRKWSRVHPIKLFLSF